MDYGTSIKAPRIKRDSTGYTLYLDSPLGYQSSGLFHTKEEAEAEAETSWDAYWR